MKKSKRVEFDSDFVSLDKDSHLIIESRWHPEKFDFTAFSALRNEFIDLHVHIEIEDISKAQRKEFRKELRAIKRRLDNMIYKGRQNMSDTYFDALRKNA